MSHINGKAYGSGILFYMRNPNRVVLTVRDQRHPNPAKTLPYPGMPDIIGGHLDEIFRVDCNFRLDNNHLNVIDHTDPDNPMRVSLEMPIDCIIREIAEEWIDIRTGKGFVLTNPKLVASFENDVSVQWVYAKEVDFSLNDIHTNEGAGLMVMNRESAMRNEVAFGCTGFLCWFFTDFLLNGKPVLSPPYPWDHYL